MFYLKYRPQTLEEIDNQEVRERLKRVLISKNIPHALLFSGPKGGGKTSAARIFAKAVNCEANVFAKKNEMVEPCNRCRSCKLITSGGAIDVIEIDAASSRKIDDIRDLIDKVKFMPVYNRYKIYIVDEVHMLTHEAFNAFLKTLEEPPLSTIFILATTASDDLPSTIISRCVQCRFHKAQTLEIVRMLKRITESERLSIDDDVLLTIAKYSDDSFRDGAKILEEAINHALSDKKKSITTQDIATIVGMNVDIVHFIQTLESRDAKKCFEFIEQFDAGAGDCKKFIESVLDYLHDLLLKKHQVKTSLSIVCNFNLTEITLLIKLFQEAYTMLKFSPIEVLPIEVAVVEFINANLKSKV